MQIHKGLYSMYKKFLIVFMIVSILIASPLLLYYGLYLGVQIGIFIFGRDAFIIGYNDYSIEEIENFLGYQIPTDATQLEYTSYTRNGITIELSFYTSPANATSFARSFCSNFSKRHNPYFRGQKLSGTYEGATCSKNKINYIIFIDDSGLKYKVMLKARQ